MKCMALIAGFVLSAPSLAAALAQGLSPTPVFESNTTVSVQNGGRGRFEILGASRQNDLPVLS
jgi:hypothetical protein